MSLRLRVGTVIEFDAEQGSGWIECDPSDAGERSLEPIRALFRFQNQWTISVDHQRGLPHFDQHLGARAEGNGQPSTSDLHNKRVTCLLQKPLGQSWQAIKWGLLPEAGGDKKMAAVDSRPLRRRRDHSIRLALRHRL